MWWYTAVILATWESEAGGSPEPEVKASLGSMDAILKKKIIKKKLFLIFH
jgi:hypothetical protein